MDTTIKSAAHTRTSHARTAHAHTRTNHTIRNLPPSTVSVYSHSKTYQTKNRFIPYPPIKHSDHPPPPPKHSNHAPPPPQHDTHAPLDITFINFNYIPEFTINIFTPNQLMTSVFPNLRYLHSQFSILYKAFYQSDNKNNSYKKELSKTISDTYKTTHHLIQYQLEYFNLIDKRILPLIKRSTPEQTFTPCKSCVYLIWSPFCRNFYIGSMIRKKATQPFTRFKEHIQTSIRPSKNFLCKFHTTLRHNAPRWFMSILSVDIRYTRLYEKYLIKKLKQRLNTIYMQRTMPAFLPYVRFKQQDQQLSLTNQKERKTTT